MEKLGEEVAEFLKRPVLEELADIDQVVKELSRTIGSSPEALELLRKSKEHERGGFFKKPGEKTGRDRC